MRLLLGPYGVQYAATYGALIWWLRTQLETENKCLRQIEKLVYLPMTGAIRMTSTAPMEDILNLLHLNIYAREVATKTALRLSSLQLWNNRGTSSRHSYILEKTVEPILQVKTDR